MSRSKSIAANSESLAVLVDICTIQQAENGTNKKLVCLVEGQQSLYRTSDPLSR